MIALCWNCQGAGSALTGRELNDHIRKYDPNLVFLMKTKNREEVMERLRKRCRFENKLYVNPDGLSGGLTLWCKYTL